MKATIAFINGNIITMDNEKIVEATAIANDKIIGVGSNEEIIKMTNAMTHIIDLEGKTLLPGFIDTHVHIVGYGFSFESIDLLGIPSMAALIAKCKNYIVENKIPEGTWILGRGYDQNVFNDVDDFPTSNDLNKISEKHPILLIRTCGHIGITNDLALELAGVDKKTFIQGGSIDKYENGTPNGVIREASLEWFKQQISQFRTIKDLKRAIKKGCTELAKYGITSIHTEDSYDLGYSGDLSNIHEAYRQLIAEGNLPLRIYQKVSLPRKRDLMKYLEQPLRTGDGNDYFRMGPMKLWADGTLGARTALMLENYADDVPNQRGIAVYDKEELIDMIEICHTNDMQVCIHAIGDGALEQVLDAYDKVIKKYGTCHRHRIVHCQIGNHMQYKKLGELGLTINIQPLQTNTDYPLIEYRLGKKRASECHAWRTLINYGANITGSSDVPCTNSPVAANVFHGIDAIVNRTKWLPDESVTIYEALKMYTINAAKSAFEENVKGTIEVGKFADLVIVNGNPLNAKSEQLRNIEVEMTFTGGRLVSGKLE